jgi:hypothetical protein
VEVAGQRALLGGDEPADLGVALKEHHRPPGPRQLGGGDQPVDATPDDDRIGFVLHLVDSSQDEYTGIRAARICGMPDTGIPARLKILWLLEIFIGYAEGAAG